MPNGKCYIGTSGWSYAHWAKGLFYPKGLRPGEWLAFFAGRFDTVEINSSFYRLPRADMVARWREVVGSRFRFAVKLWRRITHHKHLVDCSAELGDFLEVAKGLGRKRGPLLVQLPPSIRRDLDRLGAFLAEFKRITGRAKWRVAVEFRNSDWLCDETYELLDRSRAALCLADMSRCPITEPNEAPFVYIRRHGPAGRYRGGYPASQIAADAERIRGWLGAGREVYVYYNNDVGGQAVDNARELIEAVGPDYIQGSP